MNKWIVNSKILKDNYKIFKKGKKRKVLEIYFTFKLNILDKLMLGKLLKFLSLKNSDDLRRRLVFLQDNFVSHVKLA